MSHLESKPFHDLTVDDGGKIIDRDSDLNDDYENSSYQNTEHALVLTELVCHLAEENVSSEDKPHIGET